MTPKSTNKPSFIKPQNQRSSQIQKSSSGSPKYKFKNPILNTRMKFSNISAKPPLSISTTPSQTKGMIKGLKAGGVSSGLNHPLTERFNPIVKPPVSSGGKISKSSNRSMHISNSQPKQKYMSFIKKKNLKIEIPDDEGIPPAPISTTNRVHKEKHLEVNNDKSKSLSTKNAQRVTFDFEDPALFPLQPAGRIIIPNHESTKWSIKDNGIVKAYAANTNQGIVRDYNEDRVSIILNILKPQSRENEEWPRCSFFGVYDGHGGAGCADFLRDNLHQFVIREPSFPWNPKEALKEGFTKAEKKFMENNYIENTGIIDKSGSCAIVVLIVGDLWFVANVGDSRAVLSSDGGKKIFPLSLDHKPSDEVEQKRIIEAGGEIYQTAIPKNLEIDLELGPHRVLPGRLSVSRTFGDLEAKIEKLGGNPKVVIAEPDIKAFRVSDSHDFIIMGSDGIFDKISNRETVQCMWNSLRDEKAPDVHQQTGKGVECIIKNALFRKSLDNVTVVIISFENFEKSFNGAEAQLTIETEIIEKSTKSDMLTHSKSGTKKLHSTTKTFL